jgi:hypothetical protein
MSNLTVERLGIDDVQPHPDNARVGDVSAIAESLERFGQVKPIVVQASTRYVVAGNHTREAAASLGWDEIAAVVLDIDDETAKAYLLADNRLSDRANYDQAKLYETLEGLLDLDGTGYDMDYVESLGDALGATTVEGTETGEVQKVQQEPAKPTGGSGLTSHVKQEPMRDVVMLMTVSAAQEFGAEVAQLQKAYGTTTVVATVRRAVTEAVAALD